MSLRIKQHCRLHAWVLLYPTLMSTKSSSLGASPGLRRPAPPASPCCSRCRLLRLPLLPPCSVGRGGGGGALPALAASASSYALRAASQRLMLPLRASCTWNAAKALDLRVLAGAASPRFPLRHRAPACWGAAWAWPLPPGLGGPGGEGGHRGKGGGWHASAFKHDQTSSDRGLLCLRVARAWAACSVALLTHKTNSTQNTRESDTGP